MFVVALVSWARCARRIPIPVRVQVAYRARRTIAVGGTLLASACASPTSPGTALDVAAHAGRVELPARLKSGGAAVAQRNDAPVPAPRTRTERPREPLAAPLLPFRVHVSPAVRALPSLPRFAVRFAPQCVTVAPGHAGAPPKYLVHLHGTFAARGYTVRARYDGHTSRSLVLVKKGRTQLELDSLSNAWSPVTPGVHELVVFARDERGVVPLTDQGELAFDTCRFEIDRSGAANPIARHDGEPVLLSPEGTLHGSASEVALMQLGSRESLGRLQVRVTRPDSGTEVHLLDVTGRDVSSTRTALFEVAPLQNGDYSFALSPAGSTDRKASGAAYALRMSVNRESFGME